MIKRNKAILDLYYKGYSAKRILKDHPEICYKLTDKTKILSVRGIQKIIEEKKEEGKLEKGVILKVYKYAPAKKSNLSIDDHLQKVLTCKNQKEFLKQCGYERDGVISKAQWYKSDDEGGILYLYRYKLNDGTNFIKYGITSKQNEKKRIQTFIGINRRKGNLDKNSCKKIQHFEFNKYQEAIDIELLIKHNFKSHYITKKNLPDGHSETISIKEKDILVNFINDSIMKKAV